MTRLRVRLFHSIVRGHSRAVIRESRIWWILDQDGTKILGYPSFPRAIAVADAMARDPQHYNWTFYRRRRT